MTNYENLVFLELKRRGKEIYYWKSSQEKEVDFIIKEGLSVKQLIQVCYDISDYDTKKREIKALLKASDELKCNNLLVITENKEMEKRKVNDQEIFFMQSLFRIVFWIISLFVVLSVFFESIGSLITAFGLIGAGLAIALQHPILNLTGWVIILFNKPFLVGDRIEIEHTGFEIRGDVVDIGPLYTKIRKLGKNDEHTGKVIMVPNEILIINSVTNYE